MDIKDFLSIVFKPVWTWIVGGVFAVIGLIVFFFPDLGLILNWPSMSNVLPWYFWLSIAIFIWALGVAAEAASRIRKEPPELSELGIIRKEGVVIRNAAKNFSTAQEVEQFIKDYEKWENRMISVVTKLSPAMGEELKTLDLFPKEIRSNDVNDAHSKYLSMLSEKIHRLDEFIRIYTLAYHSR